MLFSREAGLIPCLGPAHYKYAYYLKSQVTSSNPPTECNLKSVWSCQADLLMNVPKACLGSFCCDLEIDVSGITYHATRPPQKFAAGVGTHYCCCDIYVGSIIDLDPEPGETTTLQQGTTVVAPSMPATLVEEVASVPETPTPAPGEGSEDHHSGPAAGTATRIETVDHSVRIETVDHSSHTPPLLSRLFQGISKVQEQTLVLNINWIMVCEIQIVTIASERLADCIVTGSKEPDICRRLLWISQDRIHIV